MEHFHSGDALFTSADDLHVVQWNRAAEELTGIPATEAIGRRCCHLLCGIDDDGRTICHPGCSNARLAREGWPLVCQYLLIKTSQGRRRIAISTIATHQGDEKLYVHLMREAPAEARPPVGEPPRGSAKPTLTSRQQEVLTHLAQGVPAKNIARSLGISEATTRNHIRAILAKLDSHSQLEALAAARRHKLL